MAGYTSEYGSSGSGLSVGALGLKDSDIKDSDESSIDPTAFGFREVSDTEEEIDPTAFGFREVTEADDAPIDPTAFGFREVTEDELNDPRMSGVEGVSVARRPKATEDTDTIGDDWSGWAANMMIAGNRLGQGVDIARVEQVSGWKKEADEAKAALDAYTSNDPYQDLSALKKVYPSQGISAGESAKAEQARDARFEGGAVEPYHSRVAGLKRHYESRKRIFEEGAKSIPQYVQSISEKEKNIKALTPHLSPEMTKLNESEGAEFWKVFLDNPVESLANVIGSSFVVGSPAIAGGVVGSLFGPAGTAAGAGYGSYITETSQSILDSMRESGVDISDPEEFQEGLNSPMIMLKARQIAESRGVSVAAFDAATAGLAGRFIGPAIRTNPTVRSVLSATAKEIGMQMTGGGLGELFAEIAAAQKLSTKDIALESLAELGSGFGETILNVRHANSILAETAASTPPPPATPPSTGAPVVTLPSGSTIVMEPQEVPAVEPTAEPVEETIVEPTETIVEPLVK